MTETRWARSDVRVVTARAAVDRDVETLARHIFDLVVDDTTAALLRAASDPEWLGRQSAANLARLHAATSDSLVRLCEQLSSS